MIENNNHLKSGQTFFIVGQSKVEVVGRLATQV